VHWHGEKCVFELHVLPSGQALIQYELQEQKTSFVLSLNFSNGVLSKMEK
jgi:hypothetical protein